MKFRGIQKTLKYAQINNGSIQTVFPLLCPVREKDWLDGWNYTMIKSDSGLIERGCVFTTPHHGDNDTVWYVTQHDCENYMIEFVRVTPNENVVKINIRLESIDTITTKTYIEYQYTGLNDGQNSFIDSGLEESFHQSMLWWEKAINHYLSSRTMLKRT
jgi:hypothetical protein